MIAGAGVGGAAVGGAAGLAGGAILVAGGTIAIGVGISQIDQIPSDSGAFRESTVSTLETISLTSAYPVTISTGVYPVTISTGVIDVNITVIGPNGIVNSVSTMASDTNTTISTDPKEGNINKSSDVSTSTTRIGHWANELQRKVQLGVDLLLDFIKKTINK